MQPIQDMITSNFRTLSLRLLVVTAAALIACVAFAADEKKPSTPDKAAEDPPILINADQLVSNIDERFAEFIGNVRATQADFVITSDKLKIYYEGGLLDSEEKSDKNENTLKKIVAEGNVKINSSQYTAESEKVEYDTATMTITMTGENCKVISGKNSISGSKIILYRNDGRVKVFGNKKKRVEATFYSGGQASDAFKLEKSSE